MKIILKAKDVLAILFVAMSLLIPSIGLYAQQSLDSSQPTVLITGSNRGIGLELVKVFSSNHWNVIATTRQPETSAELNMVAARSANVLVEELDVTNQTHIDKLTIKYLNIPIDVLINNAGIYGSQEGQAWGHMDASLFDDIMRVNVFAPLKITEALIENIRISHHKKVISITSGAGSVSIPRVSDGGIYYSISKSALNMAMRKIAVEPVNHGLIFSLIAPGLTNTDMLRTARPVLLSRAHPPEVSALGIFEVIMTLDENYNGNPLNFDGSMIAW
jgi:NAD(P)-dependent dehydrogenase (short-subunit alcohol dehydrogenase family)